MEAFLETGKGPDQSYTSKRTISIDETALSYSGSIIQQLGCTGAESVHHTVGKDGKESRRLQPSM
jgi:hypothetical protein